MTLLVLAAICLAATLFAPAASGKDAVDFFGGVGTEGGRFSSSGPSGVAVNDSGAGPADAGDVYVLDGNRIERFGRDDNGTSGDSADDTYFFISAWGADVVSSGGTGDLGDAAAKAYEICTTAAQCKAGIASAGNGSTAGNGALDGPRGVAVDQDSGWVYVVDSDNLRVNVYDGTGSFLRSFGFDVDATSAGAGYEVCPVADICKVGVAGSGIGQFSLGQFGNRPPAGIAVGPADGNPSLGSVYVANFGDRRINAYELDGTSPGSIDLAAVFPTITPSGLPAVSGSRLALDSRGILYADLALESFGAVDSRILRYDTAGANGAGVGLLAPLRASTSEAQQLALNATAGQYRLSFDPDSAGPEPAQTTADIPYNAETGTIKAALEALPAIDTVSVGSTTGGVNGFRIVTFGGALANTDVSQLLVSNGTVPLTGTIPVTTLIEGYGGGGANELQELTVAATTGTYKLSFDPDGGGPLPAETTADIGFNWTDHDNGGDDGQLNSIRDALQALPSIPGDQGSENAVSVSGGPGDASGSHPYRITFQSGLGAKDVAQLTVAESSLSGGAGASVSTAIQGQPGLIPRRIESLAIDPDEDGAGPDADTLYAASTRLIQQIGPANAPGEIAPPADDDARHGSGPAFGSAQALAAEPATGRLYAANGASGVEGPGVYVLDDVSPSSPESSLGSIDEVTAHGFTAHATIDPNGPPDASYRFQFVDDASYQASANERQQITLKEATGGSFTLSFSGLTSAPLAFDASAASVEAALEALPSIGAGNVSVSGSFGGPYTVEFEGALAESDQSNLSAASALTPAQATISVQAVTNGRPKDRFQHAQSTPTVVLGHQEDPQGIDQRIEPSGPGLLPNTTYHVRLIFQRRFSAEQQSVELTQATLAVPPDLETSGSPLRTTATATLLGRVLPNGSPATYHFEYGDQGPCDSNPCAQTIPVGAGSGHVIQFVSEQIAGLSPDTTYHYRIAADNGVGGTVFGGDRTLTTRATDASLSHGDFAGPPDSDRAWEMVSMPDTSGNPAAGFTSTQAYAANGNRIIYTVAGGTPISDVGSLYAPYFAERPPGEHPTTGWQSHLTTPPRSELRSVIWLPNVTGAADLSSLVAINGNSTIGEEPSLWRLDADGPATKIADVMLPNEIASPDMAGGGDSDSRAAYNASADASRVVASLRFGVLDPAFPAAAAVPNLYDISDGGTPQLASVMPSGAPPACGIANVGGLRLPESTLAARWVSRDGSRLYFHSSGDNCASEPQLYVRNFLTAQTELISGPVISGPACRSALLLSTPEAVFFSTQSRLDPADAEPAACTITLQNPDFEDNDVYRYDLASGQTECVTCVVDGLPADVAGDSLAKLALDPAGTRLYFSTSARLLPGAPSGSSLYRLEIVSGDLDYVAPVDDVGPNDPDADISSDGRFLSFHSSSSALEPLGGAFTNGGSGQYYLYDDVRRSLVCASCPPDGSTPIGSPEENSSNYAGPPGVTGLADDGTVIFSTDTPLVAADQNTPSAGSLAQGRDVYEFRDGRPLLITDGLTTWPDPEVTPRTLAISPSGRDLFFTAAARYTPDALDDVRRIYDARIGGGIDFPPASLPPCDLNAGACEGAPSADPELPGAGSAAFEGPGNRPAVKEKRCPKGKRKVRRHGKVRCAKRHHKRAKHNRRAHR